MSEITYPRSASSWLDHRRLGWLHTKAANLNAPLSVEASRVFYPPASGHQPEPGAQRGNAPPWVPHPVPTLVQGWPVPDDTVTKAFRHPPAALLLPAGTIVRRVIGRSPRDRRLIGRVDGSWWTLENIPDTEEEWRAGWAVPGRWNGDGGYIEFALSREIHAWAGACAPHRSDADGYFLPGGRQQLWVPPGVIDPIGDGLRIDDILFPTPWRTKELSTWTTATSPTG